MKVRTISARMLAVDLLVTHLFSQGIAVDGFDLTNKAIFTPLIRADMIAYLMLVEFPAECGLVLTIRKGHQVDTYFPGFRERDVVLLQEDS